jgi:putative membrane protein
MQISDEDARRIADAIRAAERQTTAEIVCVLARRSSDYAHVPALWAAFVALAAPWPLILFTHLPVKVIFAIQIAVFIVAAALFSLPALRAALIPRRIMRARAHRAAVEQFFARGISRTHNRSGVLIYVSLDERYARIVPDIGVAEKIPEAEWRGALDLLLGEMREKRIAEGFIAAIEESARLLSRHIPPGGRDELPDRLYLM